MSNFLSRSLRRGHDKASQMRKSIRGPKDNGTVSSAETSAADTSAPTTISRDRSKSINTGPSASTASGHEQRHPSIMGSEPQTSGHGDLPGTVSSAFSLSTKELSEKSGETSGIPQIKANQVQDDAFAPLEKLLHEMKIFQKKDDTSGDPKIQELREDFIVQFKRHYNDTHLGRKESPRYTKSPYKILIRDLVPQEVVICALARTDTTMFAFYIHNQTKGKPDNGSNLPKLVGRLQERAFEARLLEAAPAEILKRHEYACGGQGDQVKTAISHDGRAAWLIRMPKMWIGSENPSYVGYGLLKGGELVKDTS